MANSKTSSANTTGRTAEKKKTARTSKPSTSTKKKISDNAIEKKANQVTLTRTVKYNYPSDCTSPLDRKAFRSKVRAKQRSLALRIEKANSNAAKAKASRELKAYEKETLS
tara:strand:- start:179 stop:511 length:333 start_codon:yes stop_codon:yes gene_type:complete